MQDFNLPTLIALKMYLFRELHISEVVYNNLHLNDKLELLNYAQEEMEANYILGD